MNRAQAVLGAQQSIIQQLNEADLSIFVIIMQIKIDRRTQSTANYRSQHPSVEDCRRRDFRTQDNFVDVFAATVGSFMVKDIEAIQNVGEITGLLELFETKSIETEGKINNRFDGSAQFNTNGRKGGQWIESLDAGVEGQRWKFKREKLDDLTAEDLHHVRWIKQRKSELDFVFAHLRQVLRSLQELAGVNVGCCGVGVCGCIHGGSERGTNIRQRASDHELTGIGIISRTAHRQPCVAQIRQVGDDVIQLRDRFNERDRSLHRAALQSQEIQHRDI